MKLEDFLTDSTGCAPQFGHNFCRFVPLRCGRSFSQALAAFGQSGMDPKAELEDGLDKEIERHGGPGQGPQEAPEAKVANSEGESPIVKSEGASGQKVSVLGKSRLTPENFRDEALLVLKAELQQWNGPAQYLRAHFQTEEQLSKFRDDLDAAFPQRLDVHYWESNTLPSSMDEEFSVRLSCLGFGDKCSSKPPPFLHTCLDLLDEFLTNGVLTRKDPLQLFQKAEHVEGKPRFSLCYVKGMARACTMLFLASQIMERNWDLRVLCPELLSSLTAIHCQRGIMSTDSQSVALANARLSQAGSIRKAHCVLTWVGKLQILRDEGLSAEQVIKAWNATATTAGQLQGAKRTAVLGCLNMPAPCVAVLMQHLSIFGDKTAFHEEAFANKKLAVGAKARSGSKVWNDRLCITERALLMMLEYTHESHMKSCQAPTAKCVRKRWRKPCSWPSCC